MAKYTPSLLKWPTVFLAGMVFCSLPLSGLTPDPEIFDGSGYGKENPGLLRRILNKRPRLGIPNPSSQQSQQSQQGQQGQQGQGQQGQQGQGGQAGAEQQGQQGQQSQGEQGEGSQGDPQGEEGANEQVASGEGIGGELDEARELPPGEEQDGGGENQSGESQGAEGEQGPQGLAQEDESIEQGEGIGSELEGAEGSGDDAVAGQASVDGGEDMEEVTFGDSGEMIDAIEIAKDAGVVGSEQDSGMKSSRPMVGKNLGRSSGVERGGSVPSDL